MTICLIYMPILKGCLKPQALSDPYISGLGVFKNTLMSCISCVWLGRVWKCAMLVP